MGEQVRHGEASWPGVVAVESCTYTVSRGIQPGTALMVILPQDLPPEPAGDLVLTDGVETITVPSCKLEDMRFTKDGSGERINLTIVDRRWRWRDLGYVSGQYNLRDEHGYLLPWTAKTPTQLAVLCLEAMGETGYEVHLPDDFYPEVSWDYTNPAYALQQLAQDHGCVVCYRLDTDTVLVAKEGEGEDLPADGEPGVNIAKGGLTLKGKERPDRIRLVGDVTRHQARMKCVAVGEEWDGSIIPIQYLSYAPKVAQVQQVSKVIPANVVAGNHFNVTIDGSTVGVVASDNTVATVCTLIVDAITASNQPGFVGKGYATDGSAVIVTALKPNTTFDISAIAIQVPPNGASDVAVQLAQEPAAEQDPWAYSAPPLFPNVRATDRLSFRQAQELAARSVFKWYMITGTEPDLQTPLTVPGYGPVASWWQIVLTDSRVQQVDPGVPREIVFPKDKLRVESQYYNGWSRDQPAACFGTYYAAQNGAANTPAVLANTKPGSQILVPFEVDPKHWLVKFAEPVIFKLDNGRIAAAGVFLDTAVQVRDAETNALHRYEATYTFPPPHYGTPDKVIRHPDVQQNYIGTYDDLANLQKVTVDIPDADQRAAYYLLGEAARWADSQGADYEYNGLMPIFLDGAVAQVTWKIGKGAKTEASRNQEHSLYFPSLPARMRLDHLAPAQVAQRQAGQLQAAPPPWQPARK